MRSCASCWADDSSRGGRGEAERCRKMAACLLRMILPAPDRDNAAQSSIIFRRGQRKTKYLVVLRSHVAARRWPGRLCIHDDERRPFHCRTSSPAAVVRLNPGDYPFITAPTVIDLTRPEIGTARRDRERAGVQVRRATWRGSHEGDRRRGPRINGDYAPAEKDDPGRATVNVPCPRACRSDGVIAPRRQAPRLRRDLPAAPRRSAACPQPRDVLRRTGGSP